MEAKQNDHQARFITIREMDLDQEKQQPKLNPA